MKVVKFVAFHGRMQEFALVDQIHEFSKSRDGHETFTFIYLSQNGCTVLSLKTFQLYQTDWQIVLFGYLFSDHTLPIVTFYTCL